MQVTAINKGCGIRRDDVGIYPSVLQKHNTRLTYNRILLLLKRKFGATGHDELSFVYCWMQ